MKTSSIRIFASAFREALFETWPVIRSRLGLLAGLQLAAFAAEQYFRYSEQVASEQMQESMGLLVTNAGLAVSFDLFWHSAFFVFAVQAISDRVHGTRVAATDAFVRHFNSLVIESARVIARIVFWMPFALLPALYQYIRLFFVGFVIVDDPRYENGEISALDRSFEISRHRFGLCLVAILFAITIEPLLANLIHGGEIALWKNPFRALLSLPFSFVFNVWSLVFLYSLFRQLTKTSTSLDSSTTPRAEGFLC